MSQSTVIFGTLILAFIVFITTRGELPKYLATVGLGPGAAAAASGGAVAGASLFPGFPKFDIKSKDIAKIFAAIIKDQ